MRFSVVIPTYDRRDLVVNAVRAIDKQQFDESFEVVVVVDGSRDGTGAALREISISRPLVIIEQENQGQATARNRGADASRGELLLFLDDDMEAHPRLLDEHERSHRAGADVVVGHVPLHPRSSANVLTAAVSRWANDRLERLGNDGNLTLHDLLGGQLSLSRDLFARVGGFDTDFTPEGAFGNEDIDLGYRICEAGYRISFNPWAISYQNYVVDARRYLGQWYETGRADVVFARKHPEQGRTLFVLNGVESTINRRFWRWIVAVPWLGRALSWPLQGLVVSLFERGVTRPWFASLLFQARNLEYLRGVKDAGGVPKFHSLHVLSYHAIQDLTGAAVMEPYGVPPDLFQSQLDTLQSAGYRFLDPDAFLGFLRGEAILSSPSLLLTFDDAYRDLKDIVLPILEERAIPSIVFAVTGFLGESNVWDQEIGAPLIQLASAEELREISKRGMEIGSHSRTHRLLTSISAREVAEEVRGSRVDLECEGIGPVRFFAYPHGEYNTRVLNAVKEVGFKAAFTVDRDCVRPQENPFLIPRVAILPEDLGWGLRWKIARTGRPRLLWNLERLLSGAWQPAIFVLRAAGRRIKSLVR